MARRITVLCLPGDAHSREKRRLLCRHMADATSVSFGRTKSEILQHAKRRPGRAIRLIADYSSLPRRTAALATQGHVIAERPRPMRDCSSSMTGARSSTVISTSRSVARTYTRPISGLFAFVAGLICQPPAPGPLAHCLLATPLNDASRWPAQHVGFAASTAASGRRRHCGRLSLSFRLRGGASSEFHSSSTRAAFQQALLRRRFGSAPAELAMPLRHYQGTPTSRAHRQRAAARCAMAFSGCSIPPIPTKRATVILGH